MASFCVKKCNTLLAVSIGMQDKYNESLINVMWFQLAFHVSSQQ